MVISNRKPVGNKFQSRANNDQRINPREQYWTSKPSTSHQHKNIIQSYDIGWYIYIYICLLGCIYNISWYRTNFLHILYDSRKSGPSWHIFGFNDTSLLKCNVKCTSECQPRPWLQWSIMVHNFKKSIIKQQSQQEHPPPLAKLACKFLKFNWLTSWILWSYDFPRSFPGQEIHFSSENLLKFLATDRPWRYDFARDPEVPT